jgi:hypothetical protein
MPAPARGCWGQGRCSACTAGLAGVPAAAEVSIIWILLPVQTHIMETSAVEVAGYMKEQVGAQAYCMHAHCPATRDAQARL